MDSSGHEEGGVDIGRQRKYGLPSWMVNNMERLNYVTDFEQYGCSPPETEGFMTEWEGSHAATEEPRPTPHESRVLPTYETRPSEDLLRASLDRQRRPRPVLSNLHQDDCSISSPDSTPCPTPEPSPVIRRKVSIPHPGDTVLTNPGRWFYFGKLKKSTSGSVPGDSDCVDRSQNSRSVKLVISNFDLNAVSPNSW